MYFHAYIILLLATSTTAENPLEERMARMEEKMAEMSMILTTLTNDLNQTADDLDKGVSDLQITVSNHESSLTLAVNDLDSRVSDLESSGGNGTIAFGATSVVTPIEIFSRMVFPTVEVNIGDGYDGETGAFTVPPGGAGVYFIYFYTLVSPGEFAQFLVRRNGIILCSAYGDHVTLGSDWSAASCEIVSNLNEGDVVDVLYSGGTDTSPVSVGEYTGFSGFLIGI